MDYGYGFVVAHSNHGFRRFVQQVMFNIQSCIEDFENKNLSVRPNADKYAMAKRLSILYEEFKSSLNEEETKRLREIKYGGTAFPEDPSLYYGSYDSMYKKWENIFFGEPLFNEIDKTHLGILLFSIRESHWFSRAEIADATGYSYAKVRHYEMGHTLPTLDFLYKFTQMFDCSIDELIRPLKIQK